MKKCLYVLLFFFTAVECQAASTLKVNAPHSFALKNLATCAILEDQSIVCWGGRRGPGNAPQKIDTDIDKSRSRKAVSLAAGSDHVCVLFDDQSTGCFGTNESGQVNANGPSSPMGLQIVDLSYRRDQSAQPVMSIAAEGSRSCAALADGNVQCWGRREKNLPTQKEVLRLRQERLSQIDGLKSQISKQQEQIKTEKRKLEEANKARAAEDAKDLERYHEQQKREIESEEKEFNETITRIHEKLHEDEARVEGYKKTGYTYFKDDLKRLRSEAKKEEARAKKEHHKYKARTQEREKEYLSSRFDYRSRGVKNAERQLDNLNTALAAQVKTNDTINAQQEAFAHNITVNLGKKSDHQPYRARSLAMGNEHTCALLEDHNVECWGQNGYGQLGNGTATANTISSNEVIITVEPTLVNLGKMRDGTPYLAKSIAAGGNHSCAVLNDDSLKCWGSNQYEELGERSDRTIYKATPTPINLGNDVNGQPLKVSQVAPAENFICALFQNGGVKCWGSNYQGELGLGDTNLRKLSQATDPTGLAFVDLDFEADGLSCADHHCCATYKINHLMKCWGSNRSGELGTADQAGHGAKAEEMGEKLPFVNLGPLHSVFSP